MEEYTDVCNIVPPKNLDELIEELHKVFSSDRVNVDYVNALMTSYKSNPRDWKKFAKHDTHRYTRNLVDEGNGKFNLMILCWGEGMGSSIHSHANAHCFLKVLDGNLREAMYDWPNESEGETAMECLAEKDYHKNQVTYINDSLGLHRIENVSHSDTAVSLHLYSPPFDACESFDQRTGHSNKVRVTFWSKFGERTPFKATCNGCSVAKKGEEITDKENN